MATTIQNKVSGLFKDRDSADKAYQKALDRGHPRDDLNVILTEEAKQRHYPEGQGVVVEERSKLTEGTGVGSSVGAATGALVGVIAAMTTTAIVIPGVNLLIAGPLAAGLSGAGAGAVTGGLIGGLVGWGMTEKHAKEYESSLQEGNIALGITTRSEADAKAIEEDWRACGAARVDRY